MMDSKELKAFCELLMVSDPFPLDERKQQILEDYADKMAYELQFDGWIEAYHYIND